MSLPTSMRLAAAVPMTVYNRFLPQLYRVRYIPSVIESLVLYLTICLLTLFKLVAFGILHLCRQK